MANRCVKIRTQGSPCRRPLVAPDGTNDVLTDLVAAGTYVRTDDHRPHGIAGFRYRFGSQWNDASCDAITGKDVAGAMAAAACVNAC